jgi:hypothetical protein
VVVLERTYATDGVEAEKQPPAPKRIRNTMPDSSTLAMFAFAFSVTAPIFVMVLLGIWLKRIDMIDDHFINVSSRLAFNVGLPVVLFLSSASSDFSQMADARLLIAGGAMTLMVFFLSNLTAHWHIADPRDRGVLVQGAFRGNLIIVGLAFCANAYGDQGLALATLPVAMTIVLYNVLSVYILNSSLRPGSSGSLGNIVRGIIRNPLIIGVAAGLVVNIIDLPIPKLARDAGGYLGQMVLPLALLCIGGALDLKQLYRVDAASIAATVWKLVLSPVIACGIALMLGLRGEALVVLFLLAASPAATASFVMVQALGGNAKLAANIIVQTTLWSIVTVTAGLWLLQSLGLAQ